MTTTTAPTTTHRVRLSKAMVANAQHPSVWLDDEDQAELGQLVWEPGNSYSVLVAPTDALTFMADNVVDYLAEHPEVTGSKADSFIAIYRRIRAALAGVPYTAAFQYDL